MNKTSIAWVLGPDGQPGYTWNPFAGCKKVSAGCRECYAERLASTRLAHLPAYAGLTKGGHWTGEVRFFGDKLDEPLRRQKPAGIFLGDMGDLFHESLTDEQIAAVFGVMAACPQHRFYVLTKRAKRMRDLFALVESGRTVKWGKHAGQPLPDVGWLYQRVWQHWSQGIPSWQGKPYKLGEKMPWPLPNVFVGTSVCTQGDADKNIPELLQTPAVVRFLSVEPILEEINLRPYLSDIDWVIIGGES